ncbi:MAG: TRAP transporter substrate-binding protein [Rhodocyclaceae bacterium]|nr:TRAP transporter substrate-binding protein [Rhodocyclaceae bacterium]
MESRMKTLLAALGLLVLAACAQAADPIIIKFSHVVAMGTPKGKAAQRFKELAEQYTGGAVRVEVYPDSTLYKDKEELEALQLGAVQMIAPSLAKFSPLGIRSFEVFDLPFLFDDEGKLHRVTNGPVGEELLESLESRGIKGLAFWDNGFKSFSANRPIHRPEDLRGLRMRIQSSQTLYEQMRALGAQPEVMGFSEVYQALKAGVVDGTENPHSNLYTQHMHEVQSHVTISRHGYLGYAVLTNLRFWESLPGDVREALARAMKEATLYENSIAREENARAIERVRASGSTEVYELSAAEREAFRQALLPVHRKMAARIGPDLIEAVYEATGFDPSPR